MYDMVEAVKQAHEETGHKDMAEEPSTTKEAA